MTAIDKAGRISLPEPKKPLRSRKKLHLPTLIWITAISTMIACIGGTSFMGYNITGFAWSVPFLISLMIVLRNPGRITFPTPLWLPWICVLVVYLIFSGAENAFQRSIMILCPIVVGMAVSTLNITDEDIAGFRRLYRYMAVALYTVVVLKSGMLLTGTLPAAMGLAPQVMTSALLCTLFATSYMYGNKRDLFWWSALAAVPVIGVTRMGMIATSLSLPLTFAPLKALRRIVLIAAILAAGLMIFKTERVQQKMFYSGGGTLQDVRRENPDFATSGRTYIWEHMQKEIDDAPWFGHGANETEAFVARITGGITHPHNDWLRLLFDYGRIGTGVFACCMLAQMLHLLKTGRSSSGGTRILFYASATSFITFSLFMFTDNIILYAAFFGNMHFTMMGIAYASQNRSSTSSGIENALKKKRAPIKIRF